MNLGIYVPNLGDELFEQSVNEISRGLKSGLINDASIFYDNVAPIKVPAPCGLFNVTDLWNFSGSLVALSVDSAIMTCKIVNNNQVFFGYGWGQKNAFAILNLVYKHGVKTICKNEDLEKDFYRLTAQKALGHTHNLEGLIELIKESKND